MQKRDRRLRELGTLLVLTVVLTLGLSSVLYLGASRHNPKVAESIVGSILIGLLVAASSNLVRKWRERPHARTGSIVAWLLVSLSFLSMSIAFIVYLSNAPRNIRKEIPVTFLIDMNNCEIASGLTIASPDAELLYEDAVCLFRNFKHASTDNEKRARSSLANLGGADKFMGVSLFRDLMAILVPRCIARGPVQEGDSEAALWRGEFQRWGAWPAKSIAGTSGTRIDVNDIEGDFQRNPFLHISGSQITDLIIQKMFFPKGTRMRLLPTELSWSSTYVISNDFAEITIRVQVFPLEGWLSRAYPVESAFKPGMAPGTKQLGPYCSLRTMIYYDATFSKWWYSLRAMRHYENWANDLCALLERRFAWGSPQLLDFAGTRLKEH